MDKINTAAYCRVSTDREEQDGSYELQVCYFTDLINSDPGMELVGVYGDKGRSGLLGKKRPGLQKLMEDCRAGRINLILTKSISRFARDSSECAQMIRELQELGVEIRFEKEGLNSRDNKGALILNIFSAIAQEESHSISQHVTRAHEQYALEGRPFGRVSFGYYNAGENKWLINEAEAPAVRKAFQMASQGRTYPEIRGSLNAMEPDGYKWTQNRLRHLLMNPVYKGDYFANQTVCLVPGKQVINRGYRDRIYITGHHDPIIPPEQFDRVQLIIRQGMLQSLRHLTDEEEAFLKGDGQSGMGDLSETAKDQDV